MIRADCGTCSKSVPLYKLARHYQDHNNEEENGDSDMKELEKKEESDMEELQKNLEDRNRRRERLRKRLQKRKRKCEENRGQKKRTS